MYIYIYVCVCGVFVCVRDTFTSTINMTIYMCDTTESPPRALALALAPLPPRPPRPLRPLRPLQPLRPLRPRPRRPCRPGKLALAPRMARDGTGISYTLYNHTTIIQLNDTTMSQIFRDENKTISPLFWK